MTTLHVVLPDWVDDPARPSGGNTYGRELCAALAERGWSVVRHPAVGGWPQPDAGAREELARLLAGVPEGALVLLDGLIASSVPEVLARETGRLRPSALVHLPLGAEPDASSAVWSRERAALHQVCQVVTTSAWTRDWLVGEYALSRDRVHVARPGVRPAEPAPGSQSGGQLLCVGSVTAAKGYDVLLDALGRLASLPWRLRCVGSLDVAPAFAGRLRHQVRSVGLEGRIRFTGALTGSALDRAYAEADLLVLASRLETFGMVVTEALARALPVVAGDVGGVSEALGCGREGARPGALVDPGDASALASALAAWLTDPALRRHWRAAALARRPELPGWDRTAGAVAAALSEPGLTR